MPNKARIALAEKVRGEIRDLGGLAVRPVAVKVMVRNRFDPGITIDYCLTTKSVDKFSEEAPSS